MYERVATFESDPANVDDAIAMVRAEVESGDTLARSVSAPTLCLCKEPGQGSLAARMLLVRGERRRRFRWTTASMRKGTGA
jgi:hypothetical protein